MPLDDKQMQQLIGLSRLTVDQGQTDALRGDLEKMMAMADQVQTLYEDIAAQAHVQEASQPLRPDEAQAPDQNLSGCAAASKDGFVVVPKVIA